MDLNESDAVRYLLNLLNLSMARLGLQENDVDFIRHRYRLCYHYM
jgi:hypothetical protein